MIGAWSRSVVPIVALAVATTLAGCAADDDAERDAGATSTTASPAPGPRLEDVEPPAVPAGRAVATTYELVRRAVDGRGENATVTTERITVRRPFDGVVEVRRGEPPGGEVVNVRTSRLGELVTGSPTQSPVLLPIGPEPAIGDMRADAVLRSAIARGHARRTGERTVAGRRCDVVEVGGSPLATELVPLRGADPRRDGGELCVDDDGIVLSETYRVDGAVLRRAEAISVQVGEGVAADDARFATTASTIPVQAGGGAVNPLPDSQDVSGRQWRLPAVPAGFERRGRFAVVSPQEGMGTDPAAGRRATIAEVWVRGPDVLVLEQGGSTGGGGSSAPPNGRAVAVGALGRGHVVYHLRRSEVRVETGDGFVRVYGTLPPAELLAVARTAELEPS